MTAIQPLVVFLLFKGCLAACILDSTHIWPLGEGILYTEIKSNSVSGTLGSVRYGIGLAAVGNYSVLEFTGTNYSFVEVNVIPTTSTLFDYSIMFYMKIKNVSSASTVLHYRSETFQAGSTSERGEFIISISGGNIIANFTNFGSATWPTSSLIVSGQWHHVIYSRDLSHSGPTVYLDGVNMGELMINSSIPHKNTSIPGVLRIGGNMDGSNYLSGTITCLQIVPCKDANNATIYDPKCNPVNWPLSSTTSIPTSTESPTTAAPTTTSSAPTTTSSAPTTTSGELATTTGAQTTTTGISTATAGASTVTSLVPTTTTSTGNLEFAVINRCHHYKMTGSDATFGNPSDIIDVLIVPDTAKCALECNRYAGCYMFAVVSQGIDFECKLGVKTSNLINLTGSKLFKK